MNALDKRSICGSIMRMKTTALIIACGAFCALMPSCITSTIAAATGAEALTGAAGLNGISSLFNSSAPEKLDGHVVSLSGEYRGSDNVAQKVTDALSFPASGSCTRQVNGVRQTLSYKKKDDKTATITVEGNATETYRLAFSSGSEGTYTYERRGADGDFATGDGSFVIK